MSSAIHWNTLEVRCRTTILTNRTVTRTFWGGSLRTTNSKAISRINFTEMSIRTSLPTTSTIYPRQKITTFGATTIWFTMSSSRITRRAFNTKFFADMNVRAVVISRN